MNPEPHGYRGGKTLGPERLLSMKETAALIGVSHRKMWELLNRGELPAVRIGSRVLVDPRDLRDWIEGAKAKGPAR